MGKKRRLRNSQKFKGKHSKHPILKAVNSVSSTDEEPATIVEETISTPIVAKKDTVERTVVKTAGSANVKVEETTIKTTSKTRKAHTRKTTKKTTQKKQTTE
mgnify:CR=1 FL=1|jgi:hypothetical protein|tara:strand:- start:241 stop:546 length:306 start_codon:yes stop_codon:yes gene_type:complete